MKRFKAEIVSIVALAVLGLLSTFAGYSLVSHVYAQTPPALVYGNNSGTVRPVAVDSSGRLSSVVLASADPCMDPNVAKLSVAVTATGQQVALSGTTLIYMCGFYATFGGTGPTITFQYGTGSNCGTGTVALSGAFAPAPNGTQLILGHGGTITKTIAANALCIALAGTAPTVAGLLTYVQQ